MYIGQTTMPIQKRWYVHSRGGSHCLILKNAINKYGVDNFTINVFEIYGTQEEADQAEIYWIEQLKPQYNIKQGGSRGKHSEETKKKIGLASLGNKHAAGMAPNSTSFKLGHSAPSTAFQKGMVPWNVGKTYFNPKISKALKGRCKFTPEQINEMKNMKQNGLSDRAIGRHFNCSHQTISRLINGIS
jgi:group I intron endonuclease